MTDAWWKQGATALAQGFAPPAHHGGIARFGHVPAYCAGQGGLRPSSGRIRSINGTVAASCAANAEDFDFFMRKAIGWVPRQFAYAHRVVAKMLLAVVVAGCSPLSLREAGRHLPNAGSAKGGSAS